MLIRAWTEVIIDTDKHDTLKQLARFMGDYEATETFKDCAKNALIDDTRILVEQGYLHGAIRVEVLG